MKFANAITTRDHDIICVIETLLTREVPDEALFLPNYNIYRRDRENISLSSNHGGVLIAIRGLAHKRILLETKIECVIVQVYNSSDSILRRCIQSTQAESLSNAYTGF